MQASPFQLSGSDHDLLVGVRAVAEHLHPRRPTALKIREFDEGGREAAGHPELPTARAICGRLSIGWPDVLASACGTPGRELASAGKRATGGSRHGLGVDDAVLAVRRAAVRLGVRTLTGSQYAEGRKQIIASSPRAQRDATTASLPDTNQLDGLLRRAELTWSALCARADLDPPAERVLVGLSPERALEVFSQHMEAVPARAGHLRDWAKHHGLAIARWPGGAYAAALVALATARADAGLPALPTAARSDLGEGRPIEGAEDLPKAQTNSWDRDSLVAGLARAITALPAGRALRRRALNVLALEDSTIPHASVVGRWLKDHSEDNWDGLRSEAEALARRTAVDDP